jgi:hypothetical protein
MSFVSDAKGLFGQGDFMIDANTTPEMLKAKRERLAALMPQYGKAKYVGEGLGQLFTGIGAGRQNKAMDKYEGEQRKGASDAYSTMMRGGGGPLSILGMRDAPPPGPEQGLANDAMSAVGRDAGGGSTGGNRDAFIEQMMPHALRVAEQTGLDPRLVIAQAAQETGWGKSAPGNNYFGIKSHGKAGGNTMATNEVVNGQTVRINDSFRGYGDMGESADGYASFLQENPRYKGMLSAGDLSGQLEALGKSGYATDPNYANSVGSIARSIGLPEGYAQGGNPQPTRVAANGGPNLQSLMEAAANPWLTPEQRAGINGMIQQAQSQQQAAEDRYWKQQDPAYQQGLQLGQIQLEQARNPQPKETSDMTEYNFARSQGFNGTFQDFMIGMKKAAATNVTTTVGGESTVAADESELRKKLGGKEGESWAAALDQGVTSAGTMQDMQLLDEIITMAPQGPIQGRLANAFPGMNSAADAFNSVVKRVAPTLRAPGSGSTSDIEYDGMLKSLPQLSSRPEANAAISAMMKAKSAINMERAQIVRDYQNEDISVKKARELMSALDKRSIMTPELQAILGGLGPVQNAPNDDAEFLKSLGLE